jgi:acetyl esterase/lipase
MAGIVALLAKERGVPPTRLQRSSVTDANLDTPSYTEYREGYWLTREATKWFWDSYVSAQTSRKESKLFPFLVAHGVSWTGFSDVKEVWQANNNIRSVPIPGASSFLYDTPVATRIV